MISVSDIVLFEKKLGLKIVFHPLDMEMLTGGYHFSYDCKCYEKGVCNSTNHNMHDRAKTAYRNKIDMLSEISITWIATNNFILERIKSSKVYSENHKSKVIFISSISAERGSYDPIYAASKGALISFMKSISLWSEGKILSNAISPGLIEGSTMFNQMIESRREFHTKNTPSGKLTSINDLSKIIFDITKSNWDNLNGQVISVNGGSYV